MDLDSHQQAKPSWQKKMWTDEERGGRISSLSLAGSRFLGQMSPPQRCSRWTEVPAKSAALEWNHWRAVMPGLSPPDPL